MFADFIFSIFDTYVTSIGVFMEGKRAKARSRALPNGGKGLIKRLHGGHAKIQPALCFGRFKKYPRRSRVQEYTRTLRSTH